MAGNNTETVCCCFCGQSLRYIDAVQLTVFTKETGDEQQGTRLEEKIALVSRHYPHERLSWSAHPDAEWNFIKQYAKNFI